MPKCPHPGERVPGQMPCDSPGPSAQHRGLSLGQPLLGHLQVDSASPAPSCRGSRTSQDPAIPGAHGPTRPEGMWQSGPVQGPKGL